MKILISIISLGFVFSAFAIKNYYPPVNQIEMSFISGDKVVISKDRNLVTEIKIISRGGIEYVVPTNALSTITFPKLDTIQLTAQSTKTPYKEGDCSLYFECIDTALPAVDNLQKTTAEFHFVDGKFFANLDEILKYKKSRTSGLIRHGTTPGF